MNGLGLQQLFKAILFIICIALISMNIMFVTAPIAKYIIPEKALNSPLGLFMRAPLYISLGFSLFALSFWHIAYKLGKFQNITTGLMYVGIFTGLFIFVAGLELNKIDEQIKALQKRKRKP